MKRATATQVLRMLNKGRGKESKLLLGRSEEFNFRMKMLMQIVGPKYPRSWKRHAQKVIED